MNESTNMAIMLLEVAIFKDEDLEYIRLRETSMLAHIKLEIYERLLHKQRTAAKELLDGGLVGLGMAQQKILEIEKLMRLVSEYEDAINIMNQEIEENKKRRGVTS